MELTKMNVAIYGAGAMGTVLGTFLAQAGEKVDLITRNEEHVEAMNRYGAQVTGSVEMTERVNAFLPADMKRNYDIIFLITKQLDRKSTRLNSSHVAISYAVFCLKKKK